MDPIFSSIAAVLFVFGVCFVVIAFLAEILLPSSLAKRKRKGSRSMVNEYRPGKKVLSRAEYSKEVEGPHRTQEQSSRFSTDELLRHCGFSIHSRPREGEPIWRYKTGELFTQAEAIYFCDSDTSPRDLEREYPCE
jgi:hypothetical protein